QTRTHRCGSRLASGDTIPPGPGGQSGRRPPTLGKVSPTTRHASPVPPCGNISNAIGDTSIGVEKLEPRCAERVHYHLEPRSTHSITELHDRVLQRVAPDVQTLRHTWLICRAGIQLRERLRLVRAVRKFPQGITVRGPVVYVRVMP